jgi:hypothetical protein
MVLAQPSRGRSRSCTCEAA